MNLKSKKCRRSPEFNREISENRSSNYYTKESPNVQLFDQAKAIYEPQDYHTFSSNH